MIPDKYNPASLKELFNSAAAGEIKKYLAGWKKGKGLIVAGPSGCGKTTAIRLAAGECGYDVVEFHPDEFMEQKSILSMSGQRGVFSKKRVLLFEGTACKPALVKSSEHPVICTTEDAYGLPPALRKDMKIVKFEKPRTEQLSRLLEEICKKENIPLEKRHADQIARTANGDIRALLIDFESGGGYRDTEDNIFSTLRIIFKTLNMENSRLAIDKCEKEPEELIRWLEQNIVEEYTEPAAIATAYDYLSKADLFSSRIIKRQSWSLQKYLALGAYGTSLAKQKPSVRATAYRPPTFFWKTDGNAMGKIAKATHVSKRQAAAYVPIIRMLAKKNPGIFEKLGLDEKEAASI